MSVLHNIEHRAEHAEVWVAEASGAVAAAGRLPSLASRTAKSRWNMSSSSRMLAVDPAVQGGGVGRAVVRQIIQHAQSLPGIEAISITSATFMDRAHGLYESLAFQRVPARDWYVPGEDVLLWVFRLAV